jgi:hypothetical protein
MLTPKGAPHQHEVHEGERAEKSEQNAEPNAESGLERRMRQMSPPYLQGRASLRISMLVAHRATQSQGGEQRAREIEQRESQEVRC